MNDLLNKIRTQSATAFTHSGKFHADDVFSSALLLYLNPEITILRGNRAPDGRRCGESAFPVPGGGSDF